MWDIFFVVFVFAFTILYFPGYIFFRTFITSRIFSFLVAPVFSLACYSTIPFVCGQIGISCSWHTILLPTLLLALAAYCTGYGVRRLRKGVLPRSNLTVDFKKADVGILLTYLALSLVLVIVIFARSLDGSLSFTEEYDNYFHLGVIRTFLETSNFSLSNVTVYPLSANEYGSPWGAPTASLYPALWHVFATIVISFTNCPLTLGVNAVNTLLASIFYASNCFLLIKVLFPSKKHLIAGAICTPAFAAFPWGFLMYGPLYPNLLAFSILPLFFALVILFFKANASRFSRYMYCCLSLVTACLIAIAHPNALFSAMVFLFPFSCWLIITKLRFRDISQKKHTVVKTVLVVALISIFAVGWYLLFKAPFMQSVTSFTWPAFASKSQALVNVALISFTQMSAPQIALGFLVGLGLIFSMVKKKYLWLSASYGFAVIIYFFCVTSNGFLKHLFAGFWYTDSYRVSAMLAIIALPLAVLGAVIAYDALSKLFTVIFKNEGFQIKSRFIPLFLGFLFLVVNFYPNYSLYGNGTVTTSFGTVVKQIEECNNRIYDSEEKAFINDVKHLIENDAVILNDPFDGSAFLYGSDGLNVYYRQFHRYNSSSETETSKLLRTRLGKSLEDKEVINAIKSIDVKYLLLLDVPGDSDTPTRMEWDFYGSIDNWIGLYCVDSNTSGVELMLKRGDMRLYKITL